MIRPQMIILALAFSAMSAVGAFALQTTWLNFGITPTAHSCGRC